MEMSAILDKWPPKWQIQWHDVFGNTFSEIDAPENLYTVVPATSGHLRFGAKVAPRGRWPLVAGNGNS